ncbi:amidohydrolase family protein [Paenibacillus riograndensis]|uniref:amidohydrolase family protein n=1 Tax=Paenibacillus riograndensis TaxID=483937 RepID=UPI00030668AA|nr:amidohydrolase family protein [Paenibacillus riograndensis]
MMASIQEWRANKNDLHSHYLPSAYREALLKHAGPNPDGFPTPVWHADLHLEAMEQLGIAVSLLSLSSPHIHWGDREAARELARRVNEDGAELVRKYPGKFGLLASLPVPEISDSIVEIKYAMDVLHADGFTLPTHALGVYLGNPCLHDIFAELNTRKAIVALHPNRPALVPEHVLERLPAPMMEFFFDTTRTVMNLIFTGTFSRFPDITFIIPHAGAFLPVLADRIAPALHMMPSIFGEHTEDAGVDIYTSLKGLYYDIAGACLPRQLDNLLQLIGTDHLLYGSDYPYTPADACKSLADGLEGTNLLTDEARCQIYGENALRLFPGL